MCAKKTVLCLVDQQGILVPHPSGTEAVLLTKTTDPAEPPSGTIGWGGVIKAFITFDLTGKNVVGYTCTDMSIHSHLTQASIENLLPHFN